MSWLKLLINFSYTPTFKTFKCSIEPKSWLIYLWISLLEIGFYVRQCFLNIFKFMYPEENEESPIGMASIFGFKTCCKMWKMKCVVLFGSSWPVVMVKLCKSQKWSKTAPSWPRQPKNGLLHCKPAVTMYESHMKYIDSVCLVRSFEHLCGFKNKTVRTRFIAILKHPIPVPFLELPNLNHNVQPCRSLMLGEKSGV